MLDAPGLHDTPPPNATRYGNWYGPGWWGGSELDDRVGALPPVDALDVVAQKHDFGCALAEELGRHNPGLEAHYEALADAIALRDVLKLHSNPRLWKPPARGLRRRSGQGHPARELRNLRGVHGARQGHAPMPGRHHGRRVAPGGASCLLAATPRPPPPR